MHLNPRVLICVAYFISEITESMLNIVDKASRWKLVLFFYCRHDANNEMTNVGSEMGPKDKKMELRRKNGSY